MPARCSFRYLKKNDNIIVNFKDKTLWIFKNKLKDLSERINTLREQIETEEATKNAFIMPFLSALGYDVFNPLELIPEYTCDIGSKKGEKIDYAIMRYREPILLIECKHWAQNLNLHDNQLLRYFNVSQAKFGLLTNGIIYKFYTDLEKKNVMDGIPFFEFDILNLKDYQIEEIKKFHKSCFDIKNILDTATDLKYSSELKKLIQTELNAPSEGLVRLLVKKIYSGLMNQKAMDYFSPLVKKSFSSLISDIINDRLKSALNIGSTQSELMQSEQSGASLPEKRSVETTESEMEGFYIIRAMLQDSISPDRLSYCDTLNYFAITVDNSTRNTICRLYLNGMKKYIGILGDDKKEVKYLITQIYDIFKYKEELIKSLVIFDK
jgi:hypothetical protein